ncbi:hypothetical protein OG594_46985 [Streptomyces sp. NBC_01214]|uniref:hypothetical protein n=1 Tax=Streptomyces sp. NBC_01214 TaxID=2903777 RepID=UPI00225B61C8|nr:hypothetical protein [Streptomyces sp. NBC_01214]MCX4809003.1 hypothetical protein [Streptomyces sp. NBC_01214]
MKQYYKAEVFVRTTAGELVTIYADTTGPVGMSVSEVRAAAERSALAQVRGGRVEGSRVSTDGKHHR